MITTDNSWAIGKANRYVAIMTSLICATLAVGYFQDVFRHRITATHFVVVFSVIAIQLSISLAVYFRNKTSNYYKYFALIGYTIVYCIAIFIRASYFTYVFIFPVTILYSLYENVKLVKIISIGTGIINIAKIIYQISAGYTSPDDITGYVIQLAFVSLVGIGLYMNTLLGLQINQRKFNQLAEYAEKAEEANKSKSNFLANMSHEIRTPMNAILGIAQIQLQKGSLSEEYAAELNKIYNSGTSLLGIINDILDMSKIETGKMELVPIEYDVPSLINDTMQFNVVRKGAKKIDFILDIDDDLPSKLFGDEIRLKQILNNLLSNAVKYTERGHVKLSIKHHAQGDDVLLTFVVEDTGQGMKPEDTEKLFTEYLRFNTGANRSTEGTGIGLHITKNLVKLMNGSINVISEFGKGSTFTVIVKQKAVNCDVIGSELAQRLREFTFTDKKRLSELHIARVPMPYGKVLVVDDVETNLYVAEGLLRLYDLQIETAISGFVAIEKIENNAVYDVIFMDHMMPLMDGIETVHKLRAMGYGGVIVALTANALTGNDEMFKQNGFDDFIAKPIDIRRLNEILNQYIRDRHLDEAKKYKEETVTKTAAALSPKLLEVFCRDAAKSANTLRETVENGDIKLFTITAHAMKSALANVGEHKLSKRALVLEEAGKNNNKVFIAENANDFIEALEKTTERLRPEKTDDSENANIAEDTAFLLEKLQVMKTACANYDDAAAYVAHTELKEKTWKPATTAALENIRDLLFLDSDFEGAVEKIETLIKSYG